jgi:hypothetical protein
VTRRGGRYTHLDVFSARDWGLVIYDEVHLLATPMTPSTPPTANASSPNRAAPTRSSIPPTCSPPARSTTTRPAADPSGSLGGPPRRTLGPWGVPDTIGVVAVASTPYRWRLAEYLRAWEAEVFEGRTELVDGEVWPVSIGTWHGDAAARVLRALPNDEHLVSTASLPTADSLPDPDCWVRPVSAQPTTQLSERISSWAPTDVLLVVEIADETLDQDLGPKATLYAQAGYPVYWAVTRHGIYIHTHPTPDGYRTRVLHSPADHVPVPYTAINLAVSDLIGSTA